MDYLGRQRRIGAILGREGIDALLITHLPNIRYLCGFTGSSAGMILRKTGSVFFSDGRYRDQANAEVEGARIAIGRDSPLVSAAEWLSGRFSGSPSGHRHAKQRLIVGIEGEHLSVAGRVRLAEKLGTAFRVKEAPPLIEQARIIKDAAEIRLIKAAVNMASGLFQTVLDSIRPGLTENEVAAELEFAARQAGAQSMSFDTIIASGKRSALPHGVASATKIPSRGFVVCDFGVILAGYCSDMTRTVYIGAATTKARSVYGAVLEAQRAAIGAVKPGVSVSEIDAAARNLLKERGLGKYFSHSTGHGVGLEIHEAPRVGAGQSDVLLPGMVITIEPGVYFPQKFGIRIEDMVLVTETGCEVLTPTGKELITL
jgi:Xaa-Pro aminopeptidase